MTIPDDVRAKAYELLAGLSDDREPDTQSDVARIVAALLAEREAATARERERAAKIAEAWVGCEEIATAIRSPDKAPRLQPDDAVETWQAAIDAALSEPMP